MSVANGRPVWTEGHFNRLAAQDDLGIESLGASLLRELVPGLVETSVSAGYYAYYPFLLDEFQRRSPDELQRSVFQSFYRRQEAAFAVACSTHQHRGELRGINGITKCAEAASEARSSGSVDIARLAAPEAYMKTGLGGYGLFYRPALQDIGATQLGAGNSRVDRVSRYGAGPAEAVREIIESTTYWQQYSSVDIVPLPVLEELGAALCPCNIPGRSDHQPIVELFFGPRLESELWAAQRRYRTESFGLLLEFHAQRPDEFVGVGAWRRALLAGRLGDRPWVTSFGHHREAWRAYQLRETMVATLDVIWCCFLKSFHGRFSRSRVDVRDELVNRVRWTEFDTTLDAPFERLVAAVAHADLSPDEWIAIAERAMHVQPETLAQSMTAAVWLLGGIATPQQGDQQFQTLLDRGGSARWSFTHISAWLNGQVGKTSSEVLATLIDRLVYRHFQVAISKVTMTDHRDPFCLADDDSGELRLLRDDEPFWTGARFDTLNHLLWTVGALTTPSGDARPTALGRQLLEQVSADA